MAVVADSEEVEEEGSEEVEEEGSEEEEEEVVDSEVSYVQWIRLGEVTI